MEFLKVMKDAGSFKGIVKNATLWKKIFENGPPYNQPIGLLGQLYDNANFKKLLVKKIKN